jgi:acyl carrier protein
VSDFATRIAEICRALGLLEPDGELKPLDSLQQINLVVEVETSLPCSLPSDGLRREIFASLAAFVAFVEQHAHPR